MPGSAERPVKTTHAWGPASRRRFASARRAVAQSAEAAAGLETIHLKADATEDFFTGDMISSRPFSGSPSTRAVWFIRSASLQVSAEPGEYTSIFVDPIISRVYRYA